MLWRVLVVLIAVGLEGAGLVSFGPGLVRVRDLPRQWRILLGGARQHPCGGYAGGVVQLSTGAALVVLTFTRRVVPVLAAAMFSAVLLAVLAVGLEAGR